MSRTVDVAVAVQFAGPEVGFLLAFNPKWKGYAFPSRKIRPTDPNHEFAALEAFRDATGVPHRRCAAEPLFHSEVTNTSQRTGEPTRYRYHGFQIKLHEGDGPVPLPASIGPACRLLYLPLGPADRITFGSADLITWTARHVIGELVSNQNVAVAAVVRGARPRREHLMIWYPSYGGYFPVSSRVRAEVSPQFQAIQGFRDDTGYQPRVVPGPAAEATDEHHSPRFGCVRRFRYRVVPLAVPGVDLSRANNALERALDAQGLLWRWVPDAELDDPVLYGLSGSVGAIRDALRQVEVPAVPPPSDE